MKEETTVAASRTMEPFEWLRKQLDDGCPDLVRQMIRQFAQELMGAEADALCGAPNGERHPERVNHRNGYRERRFDTRAGTIDLDIPRLRQGSYSPTGRSRHAGGLSRRCCVRSPTHTWRGSPPAASTSSSGSQRHQTAQSEIPVKSL